MAAWVRQTTGITVPARRITPAQYRAGEPGFIGHGEIDPGRRSDPGPDFPWSHFLDRYADATNQEAPMPPTDSDDLTLRLQQRLNILGYGLVEDGIAGPKTLGAALHAIVALDQERTDLKATLTETGQLLENELRLHAETRDRADRLDQLLENLGQGHPDIVRKAALLDRLAGATSDYADAGDALDEARRAAGEPYGLPEVGHG
jgi:peptidoglycan hydrolase-like protein with peptidoglycan-binding domain